MVEVKKTTIWLRKKDAEKPIDGRIKNQGVIMIENKIILIEDDKEIRGMINDYLSGEFEVTAFNDEKKSEMDELITKLVKKGQPLTHIYAEHENEIPVCLRTLYNYIDDGGLTVKNIDLRRKTGYKKRGKGYQPSIGFANIEFRQGRTYTDFEYAMKVKYTEDEVVEMDTVKGVREQGKRLLTMIFRKNNVMLLFLMPDGKAEPVKRVFDYLETGLGIEVFRRLFPVVLTDNGSEFKKVDELELTTDEDGFLIYRTSLYYCDPMAS